MIYAFKSQLKCCSFRILRTCQVAGIWRVLRDFERSNCALVRLTHTVGKHNCKNTQKTHTHGDMQECTDSKHIATLKGQTKIQNKPKRNKTKCTQTRQTKHATATAVNLPLSGVEMRRKIWYNRGILSLRPRMGVGMHGRAYGTAIPSIFKIKFKLGAINMHRWSVQNVHFPVVRADGKLAIGIFTNQVCKILTAKPWRCCWQFAKRHKNI